MSSIDLADRIHNHNYRLDPYVRSLLDTDFYKLLMAYFVWKHFRDVEVTFALKNRTKSVTLPDVISQNDLVAQLDHVRSLSCSEPELIWLQGNTFYGQKGIFPGAFIDALRGLRLPPYDLLVRHDTGEYELTFSGKWWEVTLWEIYALSIINEARSRAAMADMSHYELKVLYANATTLLVGKLKRLKENNVPRIAEFGTRRRHGFLWQDFVLEAMQEELGANFLGTSNALHAMRRGIEAIGTNAHELPMTLAALARISAPESRDALYGSQFELLRLWQETFDGNLLVGLPDTFGTTQFLKGVGEAYPEIRDWRGFREDSKDPMTGGIEKVGFWKSIGCDPREKLQLFSDGLDVDAMIQLHRFFNGTIMDGYGWGTLATNDFRGCDPRGGARLDPISIVCKVKSVRRWNDGRMQEEGAVKLSDNYDKATGSPEDITYYRSVFGSLGMSNAPVTV